MNSKELARKLGVSDSYARKLCQRGKVAGAKKWGSMWFAPDRSRRIVPPWPWESSEEVAKRLGMCKPHVTALCQRGDLEAYKGLGFRAWHVKKGAMPT